MKSEPAGSSFEIESKYLLKSKSIPLIVDLMSANANKGKLIVAGVRDILIEDVYYDTPSFIMAANGLCLRLRQIPERPLKLTLKKEVVPLSLQGATVDRSELEGIATAGYIRDTIESLAWISKSQGISTDDTPDSILRSYGLKPVFRLSNKRKIHTLVTNNATLELSIDKGTVRKGKTSASLRELEVELLSGSEKELQKFSRQLERHIPDLEPSTESKYRRGLKLLGKWISDEKWIASELEIWQSELNSAFKRFIRNLDWSRKSREVRAIHKTRVSIRQLLTFLEFLDIDRDRSGTADLKRSFKSIQKQLGAIRDIDVMAIHYNEHVQTPAVEGMKALLSMRRDQLWAHSDSLRTGDGDKTLRNEWNTFITSSLVEAVQNVHVARRYEVLHNKLLEASHAYLEVSEETGPTSEASMRKLHKVRIAGKKMRYATEYLQFALPGNSYSGSDKYVRMQDELGRLQDLFMFQSQFDYFQETLGPIAGRQFKTLKNNVQLKLEKLLIELDLSSYLSTPLQSKHSLQSIKGIGKSTEMKLRNAGIQNIEQLIEQIEGSFSDLSLDSSTRALSKRYDWLTQARKLVNNV